jgi:GGDEF domain-containing protein
MNAYHHALAVVLKEAEGTQDVLTGTLPPSAFRRAVSAWMNVGDTSHMPSSTLLLIRIDRTERVSRSEAAHDLRVIAQLAHPVVRSTDVVGRVDADTIGILLPSTAPLQAEVTARRLRASIATRSADNGTAFTISVGLCSALATDPWRGASEALTLAQLEGGDVTVVANTIIEERRAA